MSYRDVEFINPLDLFAAQRESAADWDDMLAERLRIGDGQPLMRLDELTALDADLRDEPRLFVQYDRFSPALPRHPKPRP